MYATHHHHVRHQDFPQLAVHPTCSIPAGESLGYAFIGFDNDQACEEAYFKMNNAVIDDRRIKVGCDVHLHVCLMCIFMCA